MATGWENANLFGRIRIRQGEMESERQPNEDDFEQIIDIFNPGLTDFQERDSDSKIRDTFNGTPASALQTMADGMQGSIVSRAIHWLRYQLPNQVLKGVDPVIEWLQNVEDYMTTVYGQSGFYPALGPYFRAALSVGTPAMITEEDTLTGKIQCTVPHPRENFFRFDAFGVPVQYHRKFKKTITELEIELKQLGIDKSAMSDTTQNAMKQGNGGKKVDVIQVYYREDDPIFEGITLSGDNGDIKPQRPWRTYIIEAGADANNTGDKTPFYAQGYWSRPHAVWRYEVSTDETYARTPAWYSLHDARGEIGASKSLMTAAEGYVRQNYLASQDMRGQIRRKPGSTTFLATSESSVKEMPHNGKSYPIGSEERNRMVGNVERWFDVPFYTILQRQLIAGGTPVTATQIIGVEGEQALLRGTRIGRIVNDVLTPIDDRFFSIEFRSGRMPQPSDEVVDLLNEAGIGRVDAEFIGPLLQAQKKASVVRRFMEGKGIIDEFIASAPQLTHKIKWEGLMEKTLEGIGFDQASIVPADEFEEIMKAIAAREQEKQQAEAAIATADAAPKLGKAVEANSPIAAASGGV